MLYKVSVVGKTVVRPVAPFRASPGTLAKRQVRQPELVNQIGFDRIGGGGVGDATETTFAAAFAATGSICRAGT